MTEENKVFSGIGLWADEVTKKAERADRRFRNTPLAGETFTPLDFENMTKEDLEALRRRVWEACKSVNMLYELTARTLDCKKQGMPPRYYREDFQGEGVD